MLVRAARPTASPTFSGYRYVPAGSLLGLGSAGGRGGEGRLDPAGERAWRSTESGSEAPRGPRTHGKSTRGRWGSALGAAPPERIGGPARVRPNFLPSALDCARRGERAPGHAGVTVQAGRQARAGPSSGRRRGSVGARAPRLPPNPSRLGRTRILPRRFEGRRREGARARTSETADLTHVHPRLGIGTGVEIRGGAP